MLRGEKGGNLAFPSLHGYILQSLYVHSHTTQLDAMTKLIALYRKPADLATFDKHYTEVHTPLVKKYPGLRKLEITKVTGAPIGEAKFHILCEMSFDSKDAMDAALSSPEGKAVARDLMSFAADVVTVFIGEQVS